MRPIGLHLRINTTLEDAIKKAEALGMDCFQCFFILQPTVTSLKLSEAEKKRVKDVLNIYAGAPYLHGSYWINLARPSPKKHPVLHRELKLADTLGFDHIVLHPGSAQDLHTKEEALNTLAEELNTFTQEYTITFVLENAAHGGRVIGGDLNDFKKLRTKLNHPEQVKFCIDTAHACSYGYGLSDPQKREDFIKLLDETVGIDNIVLIHLNDTKKPCGSKKDEHAVLGKGVLGADVLKEFALHPRLKHIPLILELPVLQQEEQRAILEQVRDWHR